MTAFFQEDRDIGNREILADLATDVGLNAAGYLSALDDDTYVLRHRIALQESVHQGIQVVPTIVIGSRRIEGVATEDVIVRSLDLHTTRSGA